MFQLTNVFPERIIFVSRGITVLSYTKFHTHTAQRLLFRYFVYSSSRFWIANKEGEVPLIVGPSNATTSALHSPPATPFALSSSYQQADLSTVQQACPLAVHNSLLVSVHTSSHNCDTDCPSGETNTGVGIIFF